ncbi:MULTISPECIES: hypothetical protein [Acinetobacter]|uniref:Uncharacterized protein n=1 Tax=Acinetobacter higginsii TaxID=70347 RepID=N8XT49_9GAMM|nr:MULTISPECIES: hypothetical protein [Acinetobacter]ENV10588.1 hypothetical protein F966_00354 [Acinetobacter higginsii]MCH7305482.1 hypothetical protein [Acinetobacter higginsii]MCH7380011.1 hypothetical protein [Acinetobacter higginsii]MDO3666270.1 hypothetical protein [Acinetobacter higginsii]
MEFIKYIGIKFLIKLKWFLIFLIALIVLLGVIAFIADTFFDNAARKDSCADSGGAWDYNLNQCEYRSNIPKKSG